ncbi:MAG: peptidoglycan DD-metalloendopeptidase family protein [Alphaproteobacteria bacterium]
MMWNLGRELTMNARRLAPYGYFAVASIALPLTAFAALSKLSDETSSLVAAARSATSNTFASTTAIPALEVEREIRLGRGETLVEALRRTGFNREQSASLAASLNGKVNVAALKAGTPLTLTYQEGQPYEIANAALTFRAGPGQEVHLNLNGTHASGKVVQHTLKNEQSVAVGHIHNSLYEDATEAGLPANLIKPFIDLFAWDIDYTRDIHPGDTFKVVFEETTDDLGKRVKTGRILAASFTVGGQTKQAFWFAEGNGKGDYYNEKGENKRKLLLRTPLETYRISSGFNLNRKHPVLGFTRAHKGTDFAAPIGTPVMASGDGVVTFVGRHGGHGNFVKIKHNGTFQTAYAHLQRYAQGLRMGSKVRQGQTIAYVGSTGVSTGPHLHYEVIKNNTHVNAMSTDLPTGSLMAGTAKRKFLAMVDGFKSKWTKAFTQLADNTPTRKRV